MQNGCLDLTLGELADWVGGETSGDAGTHITGISGLESARSGDIVFVEQERLLPSAVASAASAIITTRNAPCDGKPALITDNPRHAFARIMQLLAAKPPASGGTHSTAQMGEDVRIGEGTSIGPLVVIGDNVTIGDHVAIGALTTIGDDTIIGDACCIHSQVSIKNKVRIGNHVILHTGSVIGSEGFGFYRENGRHEKMPQIGTVIIHDNVEIGANTTNDRGTIGPTIIGEGTKIDNLVQIAHNVRVGRHCIICAQTGLSGSTTIGDNVMLGGQSGVGDHISVGDNVVVGARGGVISDLPSQSYVSGYPAGPHREKMKVEAAIRRTPHLVKTVRELRRQVDELSTELALLKKA
ncbi:MAG: UDP-3-O-(3-hydroxymyristoyl)glucosamine N-acyltransferase [Armatimonadetes bacterium]|nr:UDP-3-O-(3-hydroxymyristoyl)glucosamine N-acyltransferase [Armatimonadota bacterium]